jgi:hypothetical protein
MSNTHSKIQPMPGQSTQQPNPEVKIPFTLDIIDPYSTFNGGEPQQVPYVVDGLLTQGGFSILAAKPKIGKSSLSRYEAVCVSKGMPFLGRDTEQGEVLLISIEDPVNHVDNCLKALDYDLKNDARIHIVQKLAPSINESIDAIGDALVKRPDVRLVIIDTLAKLLRCKDLNDYSGVMDQVEKVHDLARTFPYLHIQGLAHCKKVMTENPLESMLGSTALRGETDTNIALYEGHSQRAIIVSETRQGRPLESTVLQASLTEIAGADVVQSFSLGQPLSHLQSKIKAKQEKNLVIDRERQVIEYLQSCESQSAPREHVLKNIVGNRERNSHAIDGLVKKGVISVTGKPHSPTDPLTLHFHTDNVDLHNLIAKFGDTTIQ